MEEKYKKLEDQINAYYKLLYMDYTDEEYRMLFYNLLETLRIILDS